MRKYAGMCGPHKYLLTVCQSLSHGMAETNQRNGCFCYIGLLALLCKGSRGQFNTSKKKKEATLVPRKCKAATCLTPDTISHWYGFLRGKTMHNKKRATPTLTSLGPLQCEVPRQWPCPTPGDWGTWLTLGLGLGRPGEVTQPAWEMNSLVAPTKP